MFKSNVAVWDRVARSVVGLILLALAIFGVVHAGWAIAFYIVGAILLLTGIIGWCPLYSLFKFRTKKA